MSKRSTAFFLVWGALLWCSGIFWAIWRWVPRVRSFGWTKVRWTVGGRFVRSTQTVCPLDEAIHDSNLELMGGCPGDYTKTAIEGVVLTVGPLVIAWPRDA